MDESSYTLRKAVEPYKHPEGWSLYTIEIDTQAGGTGDATAAQALEEFFQFECVPR